MDDDVKFRQPGETREPGDSKLHKASLVSDVTQVKALIAERPESVHMRNARGETPLHQAAKFGSRETIETLVAAGAQVNARTRQGDTPLHLAAWAGNDRGIQALVRAGADKNVRNVSGETALDLAFQRGRGPEALTALKSVETDKKMERFLDFIKNRGKQQQAPPKAPAQAPTETPQQARDLSGLMDKNTLEQVQRATKWLDKATHVEGPSAPPPSGSPAAMRQKQSNQDKGQEALSPTDTAKGQTHKQQRGMSR